jgi:uncharacterized membrane protein YdjX (TVP38/TMEM64 family)
MKKKVILPIVALLTIAIIFWSSISLQNFFFEIVEITAKFIESNPILGINIFIILSAMAAILSPLSTAPFIPIAIPIWGETLTIIFLTTGWLLGGIAAYLIGRFAGHPVLKYFVSEKKILTLEYQLNKDTSLWHIILFRIMTPSELTSYLLGIVRYNFKHYLIATLISEAIFAILIINISDSIINQDRFVFLALILGTFAFLGVSYYLWHAANQKISLKKLQK